MERHSMFTDWKINFVKIENFPYLCVDSLQTLIKITAAYIIEMYKLILKLCENAKTSAILKKKMLEDSHCSILKLKTRLQ